MKLLLLFLLLLLLLFFHFNRFASVALLAEAPWIARLLDTDLSAPHRDVKSLSALILAWAAIMGQPTNGPRLEDY